MTSSLRLQDGGGWFWVGLVDACSDGLSARNWWIALLTVGESTVMRPNAVQTSLIRQILSESLVMYVIWRVSCDRQRVAWMTARILMSWLLTAYICIVTEIRSRFLKPKRCMTCNWRDSFDSQYQPWQKLILLALRAWW